jgi:hypothetical protein
MEHNKFLQNFLKSREAMTASDAKSSKKTSSAPEKGKITLITIVEDCPPKSKVLEYLRQRIEELEEDEL